MFKFNFKLTNEISSSGWIILAVPAPPATGSIFSLLPGNEPGAVADNILISLFAYNTHNINGQYSTSL